MLKLYTIKEILAVYNKIDEIIQERERAEMEKRVQAEIEEARIKAEEELARQTENAVLELEKLREGPHIIPEVTDGEISEVPATESVEEDTKSIQRMENLVEDYDETVYNETTPIEQDESEIIQKEETTELENATNTGDSDSVKGNAFLNAVGRLLGKFWKNCK